MVKYYFFLKLKPTIQEEIVTGVNPKEKENKMDFAQQYLENHCEFYLINRDDEQEIFELCAEDQYHGYPKNTVSEFEEIGYLIDKAFICQPYTAEEYMDVHEYEIRKCPKGIRTYNGVENARGYDAINEINEKFDLELEWNWDDLESVIPTTIKI